MPDSYFEKQNIQKMDTSLSDITNAKFVITKLNETEKPTLKFSFSTKVSINCDMEFARFPFDTQTCKFRIRSLKKDRNIVWKNLNTTSETLKNSEFFVGIEETSETEIGNMSVVGFDLKILRKSGSYLYEFFAPCLLMVVTSWASFTVQPEAVPGRLGMLLTLFLMLINMSSTVSEIIPKSDSVCPLVAWILLSIGFVFCALLEYFVILLRVKFRGALNRVSSKTSGEDREQQVEQWARSLDLASLALFPPVYLLAVSVFMVLM